MFQFLKTLFGSKPSSVFEAIGGQATIDRLVDDFYHTMQTDPRAAQCLALHPSDLTNANLKLKEFLSGWLGGPPIFAQKYGHPRLRMRHFPFKISPKERDQWLLCMGVALEKSKIAANYQLQMKEAFTALAEQVRNQD